MLSTLNPPAAPFATQIIATLLHSLVGHALQSTNSTQEATATLLLLPDWLGWSKNGYMTWVIGYPEHPCFLANFSAYSSMLLNPTEVWLDAPPQP